MNFWEQIASNKVLWVTIVGWVVAQLLKVLFHVIKYKRMDFSRFVGAGGMPSSHSAFVTAMATSVGYQQGFDSTLFAMAVAFALVVMYDASGVRRAAGRQAAVLNRIIDEIKNDNFHIEEKLKELLGHTPVEVISGAVLGILIAIILN